MAKSTGKLISLILLPPLLGGLAGAVAIVYYLQQQPEDGPGFAGFWSRQQATALIEAKLQAHDWSQMGMSGHLEHRLVIDPALSIAESDYRLAIFSTTSEDQRCQTCAPYLSVFAFEQVERHWILREQEIGVIRSGSWGVPPTPMHIHLLGDERYAVFLHPIETTDAWVNGFLHVYSRFDDTRADSEWRRILDVVTLQQHPEVYGWESWYRPAATPDGQSFSTLEITRTAFPATHTEALRLLDPIDPHHHVSTPEGQVRSHDRFHFDGERYVRQD